MTLQEIKAAVKSGKTVHWANDLYTVIRDKNGDYLIKCGDHYIGLTWRDGITLNGKEEEFYTGDQVMTDKKTKGQRGADKSPRKPRRDKGRKRGTYHTGTDERVKSYTISIYPSQKNTAVEIYGSLKNAVLHAITNK